MGVWRWIVTAHAVGRYVKRIDPTMTEKQAWSHLSLEVTRATLLEGPTYTGQQRWLLPQGNAVAVAKIDHDMGAHVAVTVLRPDELYDPDTAAEVVKAYRRAMRIKAQCAASKKQFPSLSPAATKQGTDFRAMYMSLCVKYNELRGTYKALAESVSPSPADADVVEALQSLRCAVNDLRHQRDALRASGPSAKAMSHAAQAQAHLATCKNILRDTIRGLRDGLPPHIILARVQSTDPGLVTDAFCYPERFTKEERRAMSSGARASSIESDEES